MDRWRPRPGQWKTALQRPVGPVKLPLTYFTVTEKYRKKARERGDARKERKKGKRKGEREDGSGTTFVHLHNSWPQGNEVIW